MFISLYFIIVAVAGIIMIVIILFLDRWFPFHCLWLYSIEFELVPYFLSIQYYFNHLMLCWTFWVMVSIADIFILITITVTIQYSSLLLLFTLLLVCFESSFLHYDYCYSCITIVIIIGCTTQQTIILRDY